MYCFIFDYLIVFANQNICLSGTERRGRDQLSSTYGIQRWKNNTLRTCVNVNQLLRRCLNVHVPRLRLSTNSKDQAWVDIVNRIVTSACLHILGMSKDV